MVVTISVLHSFLWWDVVYDLQEGGMLLGDEGRTPLGGTDQCRKLNGIDFARIGCKSVCRHVRLTQRQFIGNRDTRESAERFWKPHWRSIENAEVIAVINVGDPPL